MKENVKNVSEKKTKYETEQCEFQKNNGFVNMWLVKNYQAFYEIKKFYFGFCIYKIYLISAEGYKNVGVHFFTVEIWSSMKDIIRVYVLKTYLI